jgi:putative transposase
MRKRYSPAEKAQIVLEVLQEETSLAQIAAERKVHPNQISKWKAEALQGLPNLFTNEDRAMRRLEAAHERELQELYAEIGRLTTQLGWLKKNLASTLMRSERLALIDWDANEVSLKSQAELLSLNRSGLYYQRVPPSPEEVTLKHRIDELYTAHPFYGSRKIAALLHCIRKAIQRHMREMGIAGIGPGRNLSKNSAEHRVFPYLLRHVTAAQPNHVWGIDITYVRLRASWMYLVAILDWFSRFVVSWELDQTLEIEFVLTAVERALGQATPQIWNSDQGSQFTSPQYTDRLLAAKVQISMDGRGRAMDNTFTERLWRTVKYEEVYLHEYANPREARQQLNRHFQFYNHERPHQALDYRTPALVYFRREEVQPRSCPVTLPRQNTFSNQKGSTLTQAIFVQ